MKRVAMLVALAVGMAGCGGDDGPSVTQVTVTVRQGGTPLADTSVVESTDIDASTEPDTPTGVLETRTTDSAGQVTFTVPASTPTGKLCFSSSVALSGGFSFSGDCKTLNALTPTVDLDHL
jgi:hypothetical protein